MEEKLKSALTHCLCRKCDECPLYSERHCAEILLDNVVNYIAELEERLAIMQESMETLEQRCEALDALEKRCNTLNALEQRCKALETLETVRWINMDEDEPLLGQKVLVYRAQKPVEIMSMLFVDNEYWWRNYADEIFKVYDNDYWMPLPEPPKEVSE